MTCDEFFEHLTSTTSSPDERDDTSMGEHLARCPRCRSLAETLQPALELFRAAVDAQEPELAHDGAWPTWLCEAAAVGSFSPADQPAERSVPAIARTNRASRGGGVSRWLAAALVAGILLGGTMWGVIAAAYRDGRPGDSSATQATGNHESGHTAATAWDKLQLSPACIQQSRRDPCTDTNADIHSPLLLAQLDRSALECCTLCHAAGRASAAAGSASQIALSCQFCHSR